MIRSTVLDHCLFAGLLPISVVFVVITLWVCDELSMKLGMAWRTVRGTGRTLGSARMLTAGDNPARALYDHSTGMRASPRKRRSVVSWGEEHRINWKSFMLGFSASMALNTVGKNATKPHWMTFVSTIYYYDKPIVYNLRKLGGNLTLPWFYRTILMGRLPSNLLRYRGVRTKTPWNNPVSKIRKIVSKFLKKYLCLLIFCHKQFRREAPRKNQVFNVSKCDL